MADKTYVLLDDVIAHIASCERSDMLPVECSAITLIKNIPAADVVEVRHGHWEFEDDENMSWCTKAICTSCKQVVADNVDLTQTWGKRLFLHDNLYCPRCGAKMEGGKNE